MPLPDNPTDEAQPSRHLELKATTAHLRQALQAAEVQHGRDSRQALVAAQHLARHMRANPASRDDLPAVITRTIEIVRHLHGGEHPELAEQLTVGGIFLVDQRHFALAETMLAEALAMFSRVGDPSPKHVDRICTVLAALYQRAGKYREALPLLERSLSIREATLPADHPDIANTLNGLGNVHRLLGHYASALSLFQRSLAMREKSLPPEDLRLASSLNNLGVLYTDMAKFPAAHISLSRSLAIRERVLGPDHPSVAQSLNNLALLHAAKGQDSEALPLYQRSLAIHERVVPLNALEVANGLNNLGLLYKRMAEYDTAAAMLERSLSIRQGILPPGHSAIGTGLNNLALLHQQMGKYSAALPLFERNLSIKRQALGPAHPEIATSLQNLAELHLQMGQYEKALRLQEECVVQNEKTLSPNHPDLAAALAKLARIHRLLGRYTSARNLQLRSLSILREAGPADRLQSASAYSQLASIYQDLGQREQALALLKKSLSLVETALPAGHPEIATAASNLGVLHRKLGQYEQARALQERSLAVRSKAYPADHPIVANTLTNLGHLQLALRATEAAHASFARAIVILQGANVEHATRISAEHGMSLVYAHRDQPESAIVWGKQTVNTIQTLRAGLAGLDEETESSFLTPYRPVYLELADRLIAAGRIAEAQVVLQMLKENELHDDLQRAATTDPRSTTIELTGLERARFATYYELRDRQLAFGLEKERLQRKQRLGESLLPADKRRLDEIEKKLMPTLHSAMLAFLEALQKSSTQFAQQEQRRSLNDITLVETHLQQALLQVQRADSSAKAVALQYVVTDTRLSILLSTAGSPPLARQYEIDAKRLRKQIFTVRELLSRPDSDLAALQAQLRQLHTQLIAPVEADLKTLGAKTLVLVPNDVLRYLPFAALMNGERYLAQDYTPVLFNEAARKDFATRTGAPWQLAAMGLTRAVEDLPALPAVREEVQAVAESAGFPGKAYLDDDFNRRTLAGALEKGYNVLHLASHFVFVPARPDASRIFLGDLSPLSLGDIARDNLRFDRFALVTFSACESGLGDTQLADGRDMESLGALVQNQGAQAVIATLWKVNDSSTAALMARFYKGRAASKLDKAESLRDAQLAFIEGRAQGRARAHPYFWAPFVLMGDWR